MKNLRIRLQSPVVTSSTARFDTQKSLRCAHTVYLSFAYGRQNKHFFLYVRDIKGLVLITETECVRTDQRSIGTALAPGLPKSSG